MNLQEHLHDIGACLDARDWAGDRTAQQAWDECERAPWLMWWATKTPRNSHQGIVFTATACVRAGLQFVSPIEKSSALVPIEVAEQWARNPNEKNSATADQIGWTVSLSLPLSAAKATARAVGCVLWADEAIGWAVSVAGDLEICRLIRSMLVCPFNEEAA